MRYCKKCVMPDTKPFIEFDKDGVCSGCRAHEKKQKYQEGIDWQKRKEEFENLIEQTLARKAPFYDVLVPVSGGKDSIYQVSKAIEYNLRVLAVNVDYGIKTEIGANNLNLIPKMGATLITLRPEQKYHNMMIRIGFEDFGDPDLMSHTLLYSFPLWTAVRFSIPLVFEGENSAFEYGGDSISGQKSQIDRDWFYKYVVTKGITTGYMAENYNIPLEVLKIYDFPEEELVSQNIRAVFLSHYFNWDSQRNLEVAKKYGFRTLSGPREGTFRNYVGIDEKINRIHQYMKVLKFGYGRASDHACEEIRRRRMSRDEAVKLVEEYDTQGLSDYYVDDFCRLLGYSKEEFWNIIKRHCNENICSIGEGGRINIKRNENFMEEYK